MSPPSEAPDTGPKHKATKVPTVSDLILKLVSESKNRKGVSFRAMKKILAAKGYDVQQNNARIKTKVKALLKKGALVQISGTGLNGSFKIGRKGRKRGRKAGGRRGRKARKTPAKRRGAGRKSRGKRRQGKKAKVRTVRRRKNRQGRKSKGRRPQRKKATRSATKTGKIHKKARRRRVAKPKNNQTAET